MAISAVDAALWDLKGRLHVSWFEEPVSSDDVAGLRLLRDRAPAGMDISAGEYGFDPPQFKERNAEEFHL